MLKDKINILLNETIPGFSWSAKVKPAQMRDSFLRRIGASNISAAQHLEKLTIQGISVRQVSDSGEISLHGDGIGKFGKEYVNAGKFTMDHTFTNYKIRTEVWKDPKGNTIWISPDMIVFSKK